ncbi:hypothetical protein SFRURICE_010076 [Spodoptera frugiperda]|nr:hypothetical protein SFRURICE_010076 [Spodoptera frugiperda]
MTFKYLTLILIIEVGGRSYERRQSQERVCGASGGGCQKKITSSSEAAAGGEAVDAPVSGDRTRNLSGNLGRLRDVAASANAAHNEESLCDSKLVELFFINLRITAPNFYECQKLPYYWATNVCYHNTDLAGRLVQAMVPGRGLLALAARQLQRQLLFYHLLEHE